MENKMLEQITARGLTVRKCPGLWREDYSYIQNRHDKKERNVILKTTPFEIKSCKLQIQYFPRRMIS